MITIIIVITITTIIIIVGLIYLLGIIVSHIFCLSNVTVLFTVLLMFRLINKYLGFVTINEMTNFAWLDRQLGLYGAWDAIAFVFSTEFYWYQVVSYLIVVYWNDGKDVCW